MTTHDEFDEVVKALAAIQGPLALLLKDALDKGHYHSSAHSIRALENLRLALGDVIAANIDK